MSNNLDKNIQRTRQYWYVDGLAEIAFGGLCLFLGLYFFAKATLSSGSPIGLFLDIGFVLLVVGYGVLAGRILKAVKMRLTYPRTGYVSYPRSKGKRRRTTFIIGIIIGALLGLTFVTAPASSNWIPAINGLLLGGAWLFVANKIGLPRFYALALLSALLGVGISIAGLGDMLGLAVYYLATSLIMLVFGGFTLYIYLRDTQPPQNTPTLDLPSIEENTP
jgi:hypothetical protein